MSLYQRAVCINRFGDKQDYNWIRATAQFKKFKINTIRLKENQIKGGLCGMFQTPKDLSLIMIIQRELSKAYTENIGNVLFLGDDIKISKNFNSVMEHVESELPALWDILYLGYDSYNPIEKPDKKKSLFRVQSARGFYGVIVNYPIYNLLLDTLRTPTYPLNEHLEGLNLGLNIYCCNPAVIKG